jgi:hypothetical protein
MFVFYKIACLHHLAIASVEADHIVNIIRKPCLLDVLASVAKICNFDITWLICPDFYAVPIRKGVNLLSLFL